MLGIRTCKLRITLCQAQLTFTPQQLTLAYATSYISTLLSGHVTWLAELCTDI